MNRPMMISAVRSELRRKGTGYNTEKALLRWLDRFFDELLIDDAGQLRLWQRDYFLRKMRYRNGLIGIDLLEAEEAIDLLFAKAGVVFPESSEPEAVPETIKLSETGAR